MSNVSIWKTEPPRQKSMGYYFPHTHPFKILIGWKNTYIKSLHLKAGPSWHDVQLHRAAYRTLKTTQANNLHFLIKCKKMFHAIFLRDMWREKRKIPYIARIFRKLKEQTENTILCKMYYIITLLHQRTWSRQGHNVHRLHTRLEPPNVIIKKKEDNGKKRFIVKPSYKIHLKATPIPIVSVWVCVNCVGTWTPAKKNSYLKWTYPASYQGTAIVTAKRINIDQYPLLTYKLFSPSMDNINVKLPSFLLHSYKHPKKQKNGVLETLTN